MQQQRPPHRVLEPVVLHLALDEVRDDLGVGLGDELVPLLLQLVLQLEVVLDDAVVDDDDAAGAVAVRVGVLLGRPAVRRPAGVADAVVAVERVVARCTSSRLRQLAGAAPQLDRAVAHDRDARRVVAAVLEPPQPVDQDGHDLLGADVADDAAHGPFRVLIHASSGRHSIGAVAALLLRSTQPSMFSCLPRADAERAGGHVLADGRSRCRRRRPCRRRPARPAASRCR